MEREQISLNFNLDWIQSLQNHFLNQPFCILNSNGIGDDLELVVAAGAYEELVVKDGNDPFDALRGFHQKHKDWIFGFLGYDLKNDLENLTSNNPNRLDFPDLYFFCPNYVFFLKKKTIECFAIKGIDKSGLNDFFKTGINPIDKVKTNNIINFIPRISRDQYLDKVKNIKCHIQKGDIYEMNFCQEFYAEEAHAEAFEIYNNLLKKSPTPFAGYFQANGLFVACASPERYIKKVGKTIISQPIKGTIKRGKNIKEDNLLKVKLKNDPKEQSENVMIVDLVRNDLSRTAARGSVRVDELFGIYTFAQVHHMISTVSSEIKEEFDFVDVLKTTFPMGSMTGAPKIRAMEIIEEQESMKRGVFSGSIGYVTPQGNMDFNVVIRSVFYNLNNKYLSFMVGSAITINSDPVMEYEECLLKAKAIFSVFN